MNTMTIASSALSFVFPKNVNIHGNFSDRRFGGLFVIYVPAAPPYLQHSRGWLRFPWIRPWPSCYGPSTEDFRASRYREVFGADLCSGGAFQENHVSRYHVLPFVTEAHIPKGDVAVCFYIREFKGYY